MVQSPTGAVHTKHLSKRGELSIRQLSMDSRWPARTCLDMVDTGYIGWGLWLGRANHWRELVVLSMDWLALDWRALVGCPLAGAAVRWRWWRKLVLALTWCWPWLSVLLRSSFVATMVVLALVREAVCFLLWT